MAISLEEKLEIEKKVKDWSENLKKRKEECKDDHKEVAWFPISISNRTRYTDVDGMCKYCLTYFDRSLNQEERKRINDFYESLREPMTI